MTPSKTLQRENGFTLVELAIVLMIIGLLIGGVLKGRELIENARVTSLVQQVHPFEIALASFRTTYDALPGDMASPATRIANCTVDCASAAGNGNGTLDGGPTAWNGTYRWVQNEENRSAWVELAAAQLLTGVDPRGGNGGGQYAFGTDAPSAKTGGGFHIVQANIPANGVVPQVTGLQVVLRSDTGAGGLSLMPANDRGALSVKQAAQIDRKMDDGRPSFGRVISMGSAGSTGCTGGTGGGTSADTYTEVTTRGEAKDCNLMIGIE